MHPRPADKAALLLRRLLDISGLRHVRLQPITCL
jgi:hypothetical protein